MSTETQRWRNTVGFVAYAAACALVFQAPLRNLIHVALASDTYSHILLIPFVSIGLLWIERNRWFKTLTRSTSSATAFLLAGTVLGALGWRGTAVAPESDWLILTILGFLFFLWAGFLFFYGSSAFKGAVFPLMFLLLMVPIPGFLLDRFIAWLQVGSADITELIFQMTGTPVLRQGLIFVLPSVSIEVAKECSGIRSTQALVIVCLLAGYLLLRTTWRRVLLLVAAVPVLVIKNGIRIATLTLLAIHVDPSFLTGHLHHQGGFVFFTLGMLILLPLLRWLQKTEEARLDRGALPADTTASGSTQSAIRGQGL
jgi:exosortase